MTRPEATRFPFRDVHGIPEGSFVIAPRRKTMSGRRGVLLGALSLAVGRPAIAATKSVSLDYAYYNPLSLVLRDQRLVEKALGPGAEVTWVLSAGSNKALGYLRGGSISVGSAAGAAALLARANGAPVQIAGVFAEGEWTAIVIRKGSTLRTLADLKGRSVAATPGTDPFIFLVHALGIAGLTLGDIRLVPLQHSQGRLALDRGDVDAWAGLDPFMAEAELESGDVLAYRNRSFISPGTLVVREDVIASAPETIRAVLAAYETARLWALANPTGVADLVAKSAQLPVDVASRQLARTSFPPLAVTTSQRARIASAAPVLLASGSISSGGDPNRALSTLFAPDLTSAKSG